MARLISSKERCQKMVSGEGQWGAFHQHQCEKRSVIVRDGKRYCAIHDPEYIAKKDKERSEKWDERMRVERIKWSGPMLLQACKDALKFTHDPTVEKILMEAITKVEGK